MAGGRWRDGIQSGTRAAQPAATAVAVGTVYFVTDEGVLERSDGATWTEVAINETAHDALDHTGLTGVGGGSATASFVKAYRNTTQALSATTLTPVQFNAEEEDTDAYHDPVTNNDRLTIPTGLGGVFLLVGYLYSPVNGTLLGRFTINGTPRRGQSVGNGNGNGIVVSAGPVRLADGAIVRLEAWVNSAGNIGDGTNAEQQCWAALTRIGD